MSKKRISDDIRFALILAYNQRCSLCPNHVEDSHKHTNIVIDHIIPEKLEEDKYIDERKKIFKKYELPEDFDIQGILNLRPLCSNCNSIKRDNEYGEVTKNALQKAKYKAKEVNKYIKKYHSTSSNLLFAKDIKNAQKKGIQIEDLLDSVNETDKGFSKEKIVEVVRTSVNSCAFFSNSILKIKVFLPTKDSLTGNCLFEINSHYIRGAMISLNHFDILNNFYYGANSPRKFNMRNYILYDIDNRGYFVDIGNTRFFLDNNQIDEFVDLIDEFITVYVKELFTIYREKGILNYVAKNNSFEYYHIATTSLKTWHMISNFIESHDYDSRNPESWNIFDSSSTNLIKVFLPDTHEHKTFIQIENTTDFSGNPIVNYYWWDFDDLYAPNLWSIEKSQNWLISELLPKIINDYYSLSRKQILINKLSSLLKKKKNNNTLAIDPSHFITKSSDVLIFPFSISDHQSLNTTFSYLENFYRYNQKWTLADSENLNNLINIMKKKFDSFSPKNSIQNKQRIDYTINEISNDITKLRKIFAELDFLDKKQWIESYKISKLFKNLSKISRLFTYSEKLDTQEKALLQEYLKPHLSKMNEHRVITNILNTYG